MQKILEMEPGPDKHPLTFPYCFWYMRRTPGQRSSVSPTSFKLMTLQFITDSEQQKQENYEKSIKKVGQFCTVNLVLSDASFSLPRKRSLKVEQFWAFYNHLMRPSELPITSDYHIFKAGIKPIWEVRLYMISFCPKTHTRISG